MSAHPLVSIGVPVYNEEQFLREALDSLLAQDYPNIELLISDNASTDATQSICEEYAKNNARIQYKRRTANVGVIGNYNDLVHTANGEYFCWAAGNDHWDTTFISRCVAALEKRSQAILAFPSVKRMQLDGTVIEKCSASNVDTRDMSPSQRYRFFTWHTDCNPIYGVWRRSVLAKSRLFTDVYGYDHLFLAEMTFKGEYICVPEVHWYRRENAVVHSTEERTQQLLAYIRPNSEPAVQKNTQQNYRELLYAHLTMLHMAACNPFTRYHLYLQTLLAFAVREDVIPGTTAIKRCVKAMLPSRIAHSIVRWLRTGKRA